MASLQRQIARKKILLLFDCSIDRGKGALPPGGLIASSPARSWMSIELLAMQAEGVRRSELLLWEVQFRRFPLAISSRLWA